MIVSFVFTGRVLSHFSFFRITSLRITAVSSDTRLEHLVRCVERVEPRVGSLNQWELYKAGSWDERDAMLTHMITVK